MTNRLSLLFATLGTAGSSGSQPRLDESHFGPIFNPDGVYLRLETLPEELHTLSR